MSDNQFNPDSNNKTEKIEVHQDNDFRYRPLQSHIWVGVFLLIIGAIFLLSRLGIEFPDFIFSWQMFLIALGIFIGIRKDFQGPGWLILVLIGTLFLINEFFVFGELRKFILPIILIGSGLFFIFRPRKHIYLNDGNIPTDTDGNPIANATSEDFVSATSVFGGTKKKVFSKNFRGGDIVNIFGGSEIDLTQSDIIGTALIDVTTLFGGATLLVPSHWNVVSDAVAILGDIKDKRVVQNTPDHSNKTLLIKGTVMFGGVDIKSF
jgi:predicted membrane protein